MSLLRPLLLSLLFVSPFLVNASVSITEMAWMGSTDSANHEWIELYNSGAAVDLTNWQLVIGDKTPIILEAGDRFIGSPVLGDGAYGVLVRTATGNTVARELYRYSGAATYALNNAGTSIVLKDASGRVVSEVQATSGWDVLGGVADSQYTLQRTSSGWVTALPTPGRTNATVAAVVPTEPDTEEEDTDDNSNDNSGGNSSNGSSRGGAVAAGRTSIPVTLTLPDRALSLRIEQHTEGYIHQPLAFSVKGSGLGKSWLDSLSYRWNFGDGSTAIGDTTTHTFTYPGTYVVSVEAMYKQYSSVEKFEVTILPITLALGRDTESQLLLHNQSPYEVAISGYQIRSAAGLILFTFPAHSYLSSRQTVAVPKASGATALQLFNNNGKLLTREVYATADRVLPVATAQTVSNAAVITSNQSSTPVTAQATTAATPSSGRFGFVGQPAAATTDATEVERLAVAPVADTVATATVSAMHITPASTTQLAAATQATSTARWWNIAVIALLIVAVASVYVRPAATK